MPMKFREADCVCENAGMDTYAIRTSTPPRALRMRSITMMFLLILLQAKTMFMVQCSIVRCHLGSANVPQDTRSSAVRGVLKLNDQAVGIREVEFRCPFFCTSTIFHAHADVVHQGARRSLCTSSRLDAVAFKRLDDLLRIETVHSHAKVNDGAGPSRARRSLAATSTERQELAGIAETEYRVARSLIRLDPKAKQLLVKLIGTRPVGTRVGAMTPVSESDQASLR